MRLAIFDLDGTLADTLKVDHRCFIDAFRLAHGVTFTNDDWSTYRHTTDSGITAEVLARAFGRPPTAVEVGLHKERFIELLEEAALREPEAFGEVAGAADLLAALAAGDGWRVVVATGSWRRSALLKLRLAGLEGFRLPLASADDALAREGIVAHGLELAGGREPFDGIVLLGDKPWDVEAAAHFGFGFVGVARSGRDQLLAAGAEWVFDDFRDTGRVLAALHTVILVERGEERA